MNDDPWRPPVRAAFPCASLAEALPHLRRPPVPEAVHFKIQNSAGDRAQIIGYLDARLVFDRLDLVCGPAWTARFYPLPDGLRPPPADGNGEPRPAAVQVRCRLTVFETTREDVGEGDDTKAGVSDAVKRAAVHFGVGRALYALDAPWLGEGPADGQLRRNTRQKLILDVRTEDWLRGQYRRWLERRGERQFGPPLDHDITPAGQGQSSAADTAAGGPVRPLRAVDGGTGR